MISDKFVLLGALFNFIGSMSYVKSTIRGKTKPNRMTWFLWTLAPMIAFAAEVKAGVGLIALFTFMAGFMPLLIFISSFVNKKSYWKITKADIFCGFLSVLGLVLWLITKHGFYAITFSILADCAAGIPTVIKSYRNPESENYRAFLGGASSATLSLLTIDHWTYAGYGFPLYSLVICGFIIVFILFRPGARTTTSVLSA